LLAQFFLEPTHQIIPYAAIFYAGSFAALIGGIFRKEWSLPVVPQQKDEAISTKVKWLPLIISILFLILAFLKFGGNRFTLLNTFLWVVGLVLMFVALWIPKEKEKKKSIRERFQEIRNSNLLFI